MENDYVSEALDALLESASAEEGLAEVRRVRDEAALKLQVDKSDKEAYDAIESLNKTLKAFEEGAPDARQKRIELLRELQEYISSDLLSKEHKKLEKDVWKLIDDINVRDYLSSLGIKHE